MLRIGKVVRLITSNYFGFIKEDDTNKEFFFHKEHYEGEWEDLIIDFKSGKPVYVNFVEVRSAKGPRAEEVRRIEHPQVR